MRIIGCDLHASQQTIAMLDRETGEIVERTLKHEGTAVRDFYASLAPPVVVGIEATGSMGWFLRLMEELGITCHVGHPATIRAVETRRQKHDRRDAALLLQLLTEDRFPSIWMPSAELRDLRALLLHRDQWVRMRTRVKNALQGSRWRTASAAARAVESRRPGDAGGVAAGAAHGESPARAAGAARPPDDAHRRARSASRVPKRRERPQARRLMTHPGVGPVTALATEVFLGDPARFVDGKALASYVGMIPSEYSSGDRQRLGRAHQAGQSVPAVSLVRSGDACGAARSRAAALLSAKAAAERARQSARRRGAQAGHSTLDHVARSDRLRRSSAVALRSPAAAR